ncbi:MAG: pyridoxamine 5'-phosphate oxidase family protein [Chloroflexi bacterium]|nr:pyridoxamine 5'-phosphate oxidase family protein [Chloroflexota bacterium]MDA1218957.1 pyridoxamine 5'-phosphate oxidase family protein [Chloroflexota bacterium]
MPSLSEDMKRVVSEQRLAYVATVCPDGTPNLSPKGTIRVWDHDHLVFADICSPGTLENLRQNPAIEINVVDTFARRGYRFKGQASVVTQGPVYEGAMKLYGNGEQGTQHGIASLIRAIVLVAVEQAQAVISPGYTPGVTEAQMKEQWRGYYNSL